MKFPRFKGAHLEVSLVLCLLVSACNPDEYFQMLETVEGRDAFCSQATDLNSCQMLVDVCQPAFEYSENDLEEPIFSACIAKPSADPDVGTNPDDGSSEVIPPTIGETIAANCENLDERFLYVKTIVETSKNNGSKKSETRRVSKVKVCHQTGNQAMHTIIIACPALKAHKNHHDDQVGACDL